MNYIITGSFGNISKPLTEKLLAQGHKVTLISSEPGKRPAIEALGAKAAIGSIGDPAFLTEVFRGGGDAYRVADASVGEVAGVSTDRGVGEVAGVGAEASRVVDAVYAMIPLSYTEPDQGAYMKRMADSYIQAIKASGVKKVVLLSGWAADLLEEGNAEKDFDQLQDVSVTILRPASFYSNFYMSMNLIRGKGLMGKFLTLRYSGLGALLSGKTGLLMGNYGGDDRTVFVSPLDIADAAAEELQSVGFGRRVRYVGSEEMTCNEAARIIGTAVGKPWLKWVRISDQEMLRGLKMAKVPDKLAATLVEMQSLMHRGIPLKHFHENNPRMGKVKLADFAQEFATVYQQPKA